MTHCCRTSVIQWCEEVIFLIKPRIKKGVNPQNGTAIIREKRPNICIYGLSLEEKDVLTKSLPHPNITVEDVTDEAVCMIEFLNFALVINPDNINDKDLSLYSDFYTDCDGLAETVIFTKNKAGLKELFPSIKCIVFNDFAEYKNNIKYELLQSLKRNNKSESYSNSLAQAIMILFAIRNKPYITTKELAEKIERSSRTVQRYIETLRSAGEFIEYDRQKKGWYLMIDGKSVLLNEF